MYEDRNARLARYSLVWGYGLFPTFWPCSLQPPAIMVVVLGNAGRASVGEARRRTEGKVRRCRRPSVGPSVTARIVECRCAGPHYSKGPARNNFSLELSR